MYEESNGHVCRCGHHMALRALQLVEAWQGHCRYSHPDQPELLAPDATAPPRLWTDSRLLVVYCEVDECSWIGKAPSQPQTH